MDYAKLTHLNGVYLRAADDERLTRDVLERLARRGDLALGAIAAARIRALMPGLKERAKTLVELADAAAFLARTVPLPMEPKAARCPDPGGADHAARPRRRRWRRRISPRPRSMRRCGTSPPRTGRKLGQVAQPLRAAVTGSTTSPGIDATLAALGRDEALARIAAVAGAAA